MRFFFIFSVGVIVHGDLTNIALEENACGVKGLPVEFTIPDPFNVITVGPQLAETDASYICKVQRHPNLLIKIEHRKSWLNNSLFDEARIMKEIESLLIAPKVYWEGAIVDKPVLVFEFLDGQTLWDYYLAISTEFPATWKDMLIQKAIEQIQMLRILHEDGGYIHGDTHANNWIVLPSGELKLIDFGRSIKVGDRAAAQARAASYVPPLDWMLSPWDLEGQPLDRREDIFRVVINLSNMLTEGEVPRFYIAMNDSPADCKFHKRSSDLFDPPKPSGALSGLVQKLKLRVRPPYDEIIALLEALKEIPKTAADEEASPPAALV